MRWIALAVLLIVATTGTWLALAAVARSGPVDGEALCHVGAYALRSGGDAIIVAYDDGDTLEYLFPDGARGLLRKQGPGEFEGDGVRFSRPVCAGRDAEISREGTTVTATRHVFTEQSVRFRSGTVELAAKLVLPGTPVRQAVIWVAGSNDDGEIDRTYWQYILPLRGIASMVLDKRGTGASHGSVSANFETRAADVRAGVAELRRLLGAGVEIGLHGASQGGWVAPLAALDADVAFVIVSYGLAEGVTAEDRDEMAAHVQRAGHGADELAKLRRLTDITARIVRSNWTEGWPELAAWRAAHGSERWVESLPATSYTGVLLKIPSFAAGWIGPIIGPALDKGISFSYDPRATLERLKAPQLWLLGAADTSAPAAATIAILRELQRQDVRLDLVVYPNAGHGLMEPWPGHPSKRLAPGYRETVASWAGTRTLDATEMRGPESR